MLISNALVQAVMQRARAIDRRPTEETVEMVYDEALTKREELEALIAEHGYGPVMEKLWTYLGAEWDETTVNVGPPTSREVFRVAIGNDDFVYSVREGLKSKFLETDTPPISMGTEQKLYIVLDNDKALHFVGYADDKPQALAVIGADLMRNAEHMADMVGDD